MTPGTSSLWSVGRLHFCCCDLHPSFRWSFVPVPQMRINNPTSEPIQWTMFFKYSSYSGYSERASVAMNGQHIWYAHVGLCGC